jgi:hypothetical protein
MSRVKGQTSGIRIPKANKGFQAIDNPIARIRKLKISARNLVLGIASVVGSAADPFGGSPIWLDPVPSVNKAEAAPIVLRDIPRILLQQRRCKGRDI